MADNKPTVTTEDNITTETYAVKNNFWDTYSKSIIYVGGALIILLGATGLQPPVFFIECFIVKLP